MLTVDEQLEHYKVLHSDGSTESQRVQARGALVSCVYPLLWQASHGDVDVLQETLLWLLDGGIDKWNPERGALTTFVRWIMMDRKAKMGGVGVRGIIHVPVYTGRLDKD